MGRASTRSMATNVPVHLATLVSILNIQCYCSGFTHVGVLWQKIQLNLGEQEEFAIFSLQKLKLNKIETFTAARRRSEKVGIVERFVLVSAV